MGGWRQLQVCFSHLRGYQWELPNCCGHSQCSHCTLMAEQLRLVAAEVRLSACPHAQTESWLLCWSLWLWIMGAPLCRDAMGNAIYTYRQFRESFRGVQLRGMQQDLSWDKAAEQYEQVLVDAKYQW